MTSQKRGRHAVARRGRAGALARRSAHSAFLGTSAKVVFIKIMSPRFCAFRPRRRVSAAPSRCARKPVKMSLQKIKIKIRSGGVSTLRDGAALIQGRDIPALHPPDTDRIRPVSTVPDTQNLLGVEHACLRSLVA